jgi:hypothetical protein
MRGRIGDDNSPPCLAVQVVEGVLQGLGFTQKFAAATSFTPRPPNCFNRYNRANIRYSRRLRPLARRPLRVGALMRDTDELFAALARSKFRSRFRLGAKEMSYLNEKTLPVVLEHGRRFITERLADAQPKNDGRQTPMRGHPIFVAQHATATCCRGCLAKWHRIREGQPLTPDQIDYIIAVLARWLDKYRPTNSTFL